ncbi:hypothetical protein [Streptomyces cadmiisoli]|uniref:hypothetical protein n=1 Tax=Streptomyces cadmiisoli TaxID=2184053 RepID=UPI0036591646
MGNGNGFGGNGNGFGGNGFGGNGNGFGGNGNGFGPGRFFPSNINALPRAIARGGRMSVTIDGCPNGGTMRSSVFPSTRLGAIGGANGSSRGIVNISPNARPGSYDITIDCSGRTLTRPAALTVLGGVRGGIGGSSTTGATPTDMAIGGGLVATAVVGGGLFWVRRRSE